MSMDEFFRENILQLKTVNVFCIKALPQMFDRDLKRIIKWTGSEIYGSGFLMRNK